MTAPILLAAYDTDQPSTILPGATRHARIVRVRHDGRDYCAVSSRTLGPCGAVLAAGLDVSSRPEGSDAAPEWHDLADIHADVASEIAGAL